MNKWVTGIRIAKYGKTLYENYRGIIEQIAHDDIDQIAASSRLSVHDIKTSSPGQVFEEPNAIHPAMHGRMLKLGQQHKGNAKPIILADKMKSQGNLMTTNLQNQPLKQQHCDKNMVDVSRKLSETFILAKKLTNLLHNTSCVLF